LPSATALSIDTGAVVTMGGSMYVAGDVDIGGRLAPNGNWLTVEGSLNVLAKGGLKMTLAADSVDTWDASFGGVASDTLLMDGFLAIENNFSQWGSSRSFAPTGAHVTALWAETYTGGPVLRASRAAQGGRASRASRTRPLGVNSRLRSATETAVPAARRRSMVANYISFANPGYAASHFNILEINPSYDIAIGSDLYATSTRRVGTASAAIFSTGAQHRLFQRGASLNDLVFGGVGLQIDVGGTLGEFKGITFTGQDTTADQLILSRNGGAVTLEWVTFATKPGSTGHYVKLVDGPSPFTVTFNTVSPAFHGGKVAIVGSSSFTNWPANPPSFTWLGSNTDWQNTANWSTGAVPGATDDVSIPASALNFPVFGYPAVTADVHHLTIESGASITLGCYGVVNVHGNLVGPTGTASIPGTPCEGNALNLKGDGSPFNTVVGNFGMLYVYGNYKISGPGSQLVVNSEIQIDGSLGAANLTVNGGRLDVGGVGGASYGALITRVGGTLTMTNPADQVFIGSDGAYFYGGSSTGRLTTGRLVINGGTLKVLSEAGSAADAFAPSGTHKTVFSGTSNAVFFDTLTTVFFQDVDLESGSSLNVETNATIRGTLAHGTGTGGVSILSPGSSTLTVAGLTQSGASTPMTISDVALKFVDGTSNATFSNVAFTGYASFAGALFEVARTSGGPYSFSALDFSAAALPDTNRVYLKNSGSQAVVMLMANPTTGISGTHWINIGGGTVSWP
jgi:hypothetical protein